MPLMTCSKPCVGMSPRASVKRELAAPRHRSVRPERRFLDLRQGEVLLATVGQDDVERGELAAGCADRLKLCRALRPARRAVVEAVTQGQARSLSTSVR